MNEANSVGKTSYLFDSNNKPLFLDEFIKFNNKFLILLFFYFFSTAIADLVLAFDLTINYYTSILLYLLIWLLPFSSSFIFLMESKNKSKKETIITLQLFIFYIIYLFVFFAFFTIVLSFNTRSTFYKSDVSMISAFLAILSYVALKILIKKKNKNKNDFVRGEEIIMEEIGK